MGIQLPLPRGAHSPNYRPMSVVAKRLDGSSCHLVWRYTSAQATLCCMGTHLRFPSPKKWGDSSPQFLAHVLWRNGWMDQYMPLCTKVGVGPGDIVLDGDPASPRKGAQPLPPVFGPRLLWPNVAHLSCCWAIVLSSFFMVALCNRADHYISALWFLSFFLLLSFFSSPNLSGRRLDVYHTSTHGVALVRI